MSTFQSRGIAAPAFGNFARHLRWLLGRLSTALQQARKRKAARQAERYSRCSEQKLTDELERKIIQSFTRNRGFRL